MYIYLSSYIYICECVSCLNQDIGVHALAVATIRTGSVPVGSRGRASATPKEIMWKFPSKGFPKMDGL